jgi:cytochrome c peroxidase
VLRRGDLVVASELEPVLGHYRGNPSNGWERLPDLPGARAARDVATGPEGVLYVVEEHDDTLLTLDPAGAVRHRTKLPPGPTRIVRTRDAVHVLCLLDHAIVTLPVDRDGAPKEIASRVAIDGPFWSMDAIDVDGGTLLVAGGVEDHALDRREGFFGYVDSFVYVWFRRAGETGFARTATINASERGVVVPKAIALSPGPRGPRAIIAAYGSARALELAWRAGAAAPPSIEAVDALPGVSAIVRLPDGATLAASPLLDAWIRADASGARAIHVPGDVEPQVRLGEALFFTDLMAPANRSDGALSRFTCETCHFEGYVDGRTHHTGRGDVHATTKPLLGLFNNRPHFSRALDPDLSSVAENEFRVAGAHSDTDPHFTVDPARTPWIRELGVARAYDPTELRVALMSFLIAFTPRENPSVVGRRAFSDDERAGALAFRDRCEGCHQARESADDATSRIAFDRWEARVFSDAGPIVWASDAYEKTGVVPYVHERGARVPSLRRLYKKRPYLTNGTAKDLAAVLAQVRLGASFSHAGGEGTPIAPEEARAIEAFLDLL